MADDKAKIRRVRLNKLYDEPAEPELEELSSSETPASASEATYVKSATVEPDSPCQESSEEGPGPRLRKIGDLELAEDLPMPDGLSPLEQILYQRRIKPIRTKDLQLRPAYYSNDQRRVHAKTIVEALSFARQELPMPDEVQAGFKQGNINWLMTQVDSCPSDAALVSLARSLSTDDLALLFPAMAGARSARDRNSLLTMIRSRASKFLYYHGWTTVQAVFPKLSVQKALADLCKVLTEGELPADKQDQEGFSDFYRSSGLDGLVPNWLHLPLISEIAQPSSRTFISSLADYILQEDLSLQEFYIQFGIYPDFALADALEERLDYLTINNQSFANKIFSGLFN